MLCTLCTLWCCPLVAAHWLAAAAAAVNTPHAVCSVAAFFELIGEEWRGLFSEIRTREFKYVKPDKRLLLDVAEVGSCCCCCCYCSNVGCASCCTQATLSVQ
jgi:hypothetical protein